MRLPWYTPGESGVDYPNFRWQQLLNLLPLFLNETNKCNNLTRVVLLLFS